MALKEWASFLDLPDFDLAFSQQGLLTAGRFCEAWKTRTGISLREEQLEELHRTGMLVPVLRVMKPVASIVRAAKRSGAGVADDLLYDYNDPGHLSEARTSGRLVDERRSPFQPWGRFHREYNGLHVRTAEHLYSWYQLPVVDQLTQVVRRLVSRRAPQDRLSYRLPMRYREMFDGFSVDPSTSRLVLMQHLDPVYRPRLTGTLVLPSGGGSQWQDWEAHFDPDLARRRFRLKAEQIRGMADAHYARARYLDPNRDLWPLIRLARPDRLKRIERGALLALDNRMAGEVLLLWYEDLVSAGVAEPLPGLDARWWEPRRERLVADVADLDRVLTEFGLSPHPVVVFVLEGESEDWVIPRVMDKLGFHPPRSQMEIVCLRGVGGDVGLIASLAAVPEIGEPAQGGLLLNRPLTHVLVAVDREGQYATRALQDERRSAIVSRILSRLSPEHRTDRVREQLAGLVTIRTWGPRAFEYAHFTDRQIARAVDSLYQRKLGHPPVRPTAALDVAQLRARGTNIDQLRNLRRLSKVDLAEELWPVLERKIDRAIASSRLNRIPVARVVLEAASLVARYSRRRFMLGTE